MRLSKHGTYVWAYMFSKVSFLSLKIVIEFFDKTIFYR